MKTLLAFCSLLLTIYFLPVTANAHVLTNDDNVGAVIHIDPEDDPVAGGESIINIELKDKNNYFSYNKCTCIIKILNNDKEIFSQTLDRSDNAGSVPFIFPEIGEYTINISGTPDNNESFPKFSLNQKVVVSTKIESTSTPSISVKNISTSTNTNTYILISIIIIFSISLIAYKKFKK